MNTRDVGFGNSSLFETFDAFCMGLSGTQRTDIKTVARQSVFERGVVYFRVMRKSHKRGVVINRERRQCHVGPFRDHLHVGKPLDRCKGRPRIHDRHVIAKQLTNGRKRLTYMNSSGNDKFWRWYIDSEESTPLRSVLHTALTHTQPLFQHILQRIILHMRGLHQTLRTARRISDQHRGATCSALGVKIMQDVEFHSAHLLDIDPNRSTTGQTYLPRGLIGNTEFEQFWFPTVDYVHCFGDDRTLDTAA